MKKSLVYPLFAFVCAVFGTTFLAIRMGVAAGASPFLFAGIRFTAAGLILAAGLLLARRIGLRDLLSLAPRAFLLSLFYVVGNFGASFWAMRRIGSGTAAQLQASVPIWTGILAVLFLGKRLRPAHLLGLAAGLLGVWLVAGGSPAPGATTTDAGARTAVLVMVAGSLCFAAGTILYRRLFSERDDAFAVNAMNMLLGGLVLLTLAGVAEKPSFPLAGATLGPLVYLALAGSILGHSANLAVVREAGPLFASGWFFVSPAIATAVGALVLGEPVRPAALAGTAASLFGVAAMALADRKAGSAAPAAPAEPAAGPAEPAAGAPPGGAASRIDGPAVS